MEFQELNSFYRNHLLNEVVPFWVEYAVDNEDGGINTCITNNGRIINREKYIWSQCRALWTFSALYNRIEKKDEWIEIAYGIYKYLKKYGRNMRGNWVYLVDENGIIREDAISIFTDGFALYGLTEFAKATGDREAEELVTKTYEKVIRRLNSSEQYLTYPLPSKKGLKSHAIAMVFSYAFFELGRYLGDESIIKEGLHYAEAIMNEFRDPSRKMLFEYTNKEAKRIDLPMERVIIPGHAIESMWFMIHIYQKVGNYTIINQAIECIRWHLELGWDYEYGGIFLSCDAERKDPWWPNWDTKPWWPMTEALYALLLSYEISSEEWCLDWYWKAHDYAFSHYPVKKYGEWRQKLDRRGRATDQRIGLPVKDPFHLPRALIMIIQLLKEYENG